MQSVIVPVVRLEEPVPVRSCPASMETETAGILSCRSSSDILIMPATLLYTITASAPIALAV